tara:strand:+ start:3164 stop:5194 length:2031 start_codon:yes stop_codon:yes gene_type:complete
MATTTKVIVQVHERVTEVQIDADLQSRELGFISGAKVLRVSEDDGTKHNIWAQDSATVVYDNLITLSSTTASQALFTDGSKGVVSNALTGTGNVVMSASPTLTGTITAIALHLTGSLDIDTDLNVDGDVVIDGSTVIAGIVGIGNTSPGSISHANADDLVIGSNSDTNSGLTIASTTLGTIAFGDTADDNVGRITYDHATDTMSLHTTGEGSIFIDSSQNVGINIFSPTAKFHIFDDTGTTSANHTLEVEGTVINSSPNITIKNDARTYQIVVTGNDGDKFVIRDDTEGSDMITVDGSGSAITLHEAVTMNGSAVISGNLGVGSATSPASIVHIAQDHPTLTIESTDTAHADGEVLSRIAFHTNDSSRQGVSAKIEAIAQGTAGSTEIVFTGYRSDDLREFLSLSTVGHVLSNADVNITQSLDVDIDLSVDGDINLPTLGKKITLGSDSEIYENATGLVIDNVSSGGSDGDVLLRTSNVNGNVLLADTSGTLVTLNSTSITLALGPDLRITSGELALKETTTPTSTAGWGEIYTQTDNNLYFQDGAGVEKEVITGNIGTFTMTATGFTSNPTGTASWSRSGNIITLRTPVSLTGASNAVGHTLTGLPSEIHPGQVQNITFVKMGLDNGVKVDVQFSVQTSGVINLLYWNGTTYSTSWTSSGTKGTQAYLTICYQLG